MTPNPTSTLVLTREADPTVDVHRLYRETAGPLRATLKRLTWAASEVDDLLQDVFVAALDRPQALRSARSPRAWLYGIALNLAAARRRRRAVRQFFGLDATAELQAPTGPLEVLEHREAETLVQAALEELSAKKRVVFVLYELDGLTGEEIAEAVGAPLKTVWTRLYHARREVEHALQQRVRPDCHE